jgi:hypothetical protein
VLRETDPFVKLIVALNIKPAESLAGVLDYNEADDQLVGIAQSFITEHPDYDVRLLTHDTGPMAASNLVGVPLLVIPDEWLLPPEQSEADKRIRSLEAKVTRLEQSEPILEIVCLDLDGKEVDVEKLQSEYSIYNQISHAELAGLIARLKERFPIAPRTVSFRFAASRAPLSWPSLVHAG